jgi:hypothetical protein
MSELNLLTVSISLLFDSTSTYEENLEIDVKDDSTAKMILDQVAFEFGKAYLIPLKIFLFKERTLIPERFAMHKILRKNPGFIVTDVILNSDKTTKKLIQDIQGRAKDKDPLTMTLRESINELATLIKETKEVQEKVRTKDEFVSKMILEPTHFLGLLTIDNSAIVFNPDEETRIHEWLTVQNVVMNPLLDFETKLDCIGPIQTILALAVKMATSRFTTKAGSYFVKRDFSINPSLPESRVEEFAALHNNSSKEVRALVRDYTEKYNFLKNWVDISQGANKKTKTGEEASTKLPTRIADFAIRKTPNGKVLLLTQDPFRDFDEGLIQNFDQILSFITLNRKHKGYGIITDYKSWVFGTLTMNRELKWTNKISFTIDPSSYLIDSQRFREFLKTLIAFIILCEDQ